MKQEKVKYRELQEEANILKNIRDCADFYKRIPSSWDYKQYEKVNRTEASVRSRFGTWSNALAQSGLPGVPNRAPEEIRRHLYKAYIKRENNE